MAGLKKSKASRKVHLKQFTPEGVKEINKAINPFNIHAWQESRSLVYGKVRVGSKQLPAVYIESLRSCLIKNARLLDALERGGAHDQSQAFSTRFLAHHLPHHPQVRFGNELFFKHPAKDRRGLGLVFPSNTAIQDTFTLCELLKLGVEGTLIDPGRNVKPRLPPKRTSLRAPAFPQADATLPLLPHASDPAAFPGACQSPLANNNEVQIAAVLELLAIGAALAASEKGCSAIAGAGTGQCVEGPHSQKSNEESIAGDAAVRNEAAPSAAVRKPTRELKVLSPPQESSGVLLTNSGRPMRRSAEAAKQKITDSVAKKTKKAVCAKQAAIPREMTPGHQLQKRRGPTTLERKGKAASQAYSSDASAGAEHLSVSLAKSAVTSLELAQKKLTVTLCLDKPHVSAQAKARQMAGGEKIKTGQFWEVSSSDSDNELDRDEEDEEPPQELLRICRVFKDIWTDRTRLTKTVMYIHYLKGVEMPKSYLRKSGVGDLVQKLMAFDHEWVSVAAGQLWEQWQPVLRADKSGGF